MNENEINCFLENFENGSELDNDFLDLDIILPNVENDLSDDQDHGLEGIICLESDDVSEK